MVVALNIYSQLQSPFDIMSPRLSFSSRNSLHNHALQLPLCCRGRRRRRRRRCQPPPAAAGQIRPLPLPPFLGQNSSPSPPPTTPSTKRKFGGDWSSMGLQQSKEELLYQQVNYGNIDGIRNLRAQGAGLEWIDKEGKTPLILACMRHDLLNVAKALIDLGANVNAYRPGSHAGTALHHAAKRGLDQTVHLLLSHGANPFIMNDDCHTALDLAREKGHVNVVRAIEGRISFFSGWMRENYGPGFLEAFVPQLMSRKIWAVVLPCNAWSPTKPLKLELAIYPELQVAKPRTVISLWKSHIEEPKFSQADPSIVIVEKTTRSRYKLLPAYEGDKQQLQRFCNACRGIPQVPTIIPAPPAGAHLPIPPAANSSVAPPGLSKPNPEDVQLEIAINASIQSALAEGVPDVQPVAGTTNLNGWESSANNATHNSWGPAGAAPPPKISGQPPAGASSSSKYNGWDVPGTSSDQCSSNPNKNRSDLPVVLPQEAPAAAVAPSAPPITEETLHDGSIQYPAIDSTPVNVSMPTAEGSTVASSVKPGASEAEAGGSGYSASGSCVICLDAPVEGACIPCGHMAGCMSCLKDIEAKKWGCPICRAKIDQVLRLYAV